MLQTSIYPSGKNAFISVLLNSKMTHLHMFDMVTLKIGAICCLLEVKSFISKSDFVVSVKRNVKMKMC